MAFERQQSRVLINKAGGNAWPKAKSHRVALFSTFL